MLPDIKEQRCWFHKNANVLAALPKSAHAGAKKALAEIWNAEDNDHARGAVKAFAADYGAKFLKAVAKVTQDEDELLAYYDFPAAHWVHLRTTNPIESTFALAHGQRPAPGRARPRQERSSLTESSPSAPPRTPHGPHSLAPAMTAAVNLPARKAVLIDLGGVLTGDYLPAAATAWGIRLGISQQAFLAALFSGSDDQVLTGRVSEPAWWDIVAARLHSDPGVMAELRQDLASREVWDQALVALLRRLRAHAKTAIVSNAWPGMRARISRAGMLDITDEIVLSCEAGYAKPDPRIYHAALRQLAASPSSALFIDNTPGHVAAARKLGMAGHLHTSTISTITRIEDFLAA